MGLTNYFSVCVLIGALSFSYYFCMLFFLRLSLTLYIFVFCLGWHINNFVRLHTSHMQWKPAAKKKKKNNPSRTISINRNQVSKTRFLFMETEYKILDFYWDFFFFPNYANKRAWKSMLIRENDCRNCTLEIKLCLNLLPKSGKKFKWNVVHQEW